MDSNEWDEFDSMVVVESTEERAKNFYPDGLGYASPVRPSSWDLDKVQVKLIGKAVKGTEPGLICGSFNAG